MQVIERLDAQSMVFIAIEKAKATARRAADRAVGFAKIGRRLAAGGAMLAASSMSFAAGPDLTTLTTAVDFGTVTTAVISVAAALVVVYIAWKGARIVLAAVRGG